MREHKFSETSKEKVDGSHDVNVKVATVLQYIPKSGPR
jgi:hypothetical protein